MPASSHGLPTSGMRDIRLPVFGLRILTLSIHGRCGVWPSNSVPAFDGALLQFLAAADDFEVVGSSRPPRSAARGPRSASSRSSSRPCSGASRSSRAWPLIDSGRNVDLLSTTFMMSPRSPRGCRPHVDEPLVDQAVEQFRLAAPAVRIAVDVTLGGEEHVLLLQFLEDDVGRRGSAARLARERAEAFEEDAVDSSSGATGGRPFVLAQLEVDLAATGRGVNDAGAFGLGHVLPRR